MKLATLEARTYCDAAVYERERKAIFGREWLLIAHERELRQPGDTVAEPIAGYPLFVIRRRDGSLAAFHNVCRHRAGNLVEDGAGRCAAIRCRYHGWLYDDAGRLQKRHGFADNDAIDGAALSLFPVKVETWKGFVFVNMDAGAGPLVDGLGDLATATSAMPIERYAFHKRHAYDLPFNWKTYTDNYLEGYHIPLMHKSLAAELDMPTYRVLNGRNVSIHRASPKGGGAYDGLFLWRWPNNTIGVYGAGFNICRILPVSHDRLRLTFDFYFDPAAGLSTRQKDEAAAATSAVVEEDFPMCEIVQRNLAAGVYSTGPLSPRHETGVAYFHDLVRTALA
jgi:choline monooxygenase